MRCRPVLDTHTGWPKIAATELSNEITRFSSTLGVKIVYYNTWQ